MNYKELFKEANEEVKERYELVISGISSNIENNTCEKGIILKRKYYGIVARK